MSHGYLEWGYWLSVRFALLGLLLSRTFRPPPFPPVVWEEVTRAIEAHPLPPDCPCKRNSSSIVRLKTPTIIQIILEHPQVVYTITFNVHSYFSLLFIGSSRGYEQARHHWFPAYKLSTYILWVKTRTGKTTNTAFLIIHGLPV